MMKRIAWLLVTLAMLLSFTTGLAGCADPDMTFDLQVEVEEKIYTAGDTLTAKVFLTAAKDITEAKVELTPVVGDGLADAVVQAVQSVELPAGTKVEVGTISATVTAQTQTQTNVSVAEVSVKAPGAKYKKQELFALTAAEPILGHYHSVENGKEWKEWTSATTLPGNEDSEYNYYLTCDVALDDAPSLSGQTDFALCMNGYNITAEKNGSVYLLNQENKLYVCDCAEEKGNIIVGCDAGGAFFVSGENSSLTLKDVILDGTQTQSAKVGYGAIYINGKNSQVTLDGATIQNCTADNGSAIYAVDQEKSNSVTVNITNGSMITGNTIPAGNDNGSAVVMAQYATINVTDSSICNNESGSICGVAINFASGGVLNLHNAKITDNKSTYERYKDGKLYNIQVGAVYIHNGNRKLTISGSTVIRDNTRVDGEEANIYLQSTVRKTADSYPEKLKIKLGTLEEGADIGIRRGSNYSEKNFASDLNKIPLLSMTEDADATNWQASWITVDNSGKNIDYDYRIQEFTLVKNAD